MKMFHDDLTVPLPFFECPHQKLVIPLIIWGMQPSTCKVAKCQIHANANANANANATYPGTHPNPLASQMYTRGYCGLLWIQ
jgi:hypothetical protein